MPSYVVLANFTEQGIHAIKETGKRAKTLRDAAKAAGVLVKDIYWTLGTVDVVLTLQARNDETVASFMMKLGSLGNLKSQTLRAFTEREIEGITSKIK